MTTSSASTRQLERCTSRQVVHGGARGSEGGRCALRRPPTDLRTANGIEAMNFPPERSPEVIPCWAWHGRHPSTTPRSRPETRKPRLHLTFPLRSSWPTHGQRTCRERCRHLCCPGRSTPRTARMKASYRSTKQNLAASIRRHRRALRGCHWPYGGWIGFQAAAPRSLVNDCQHRPVNGYTNTVPVGAWPSDNRRKPSPFPIPGVILPCCTDASPRCSSPSSRSSRPRPRPGSLSGSAGRRPGAGSRSSMSTATRRRSSSTPRTGTRRRSGRPRVPA